MAKVYYGGYGHNPNPNGKKYAYIGSNQYQVGQNVVAPVTHYISGKNYKNYRFIAQMNILFVFLHHRNRYYGNEYYDKVYRYEIF